MRSHVTNVENITRADARRFQYRKRYEITCDLYRFAIRISGTCFNTASGMRSHVTVCLVLPPDLMSDVSIPQAV